MEDHLVRIGLKDLAILKKLFKDRGPTIYVTYTAIKNYNNWIEKNPKIENCEFFSLNGDFADGTFVVIVSIVQHLISTFLINLFY